MAWFSGWASVAQAVVFAVLTFALVLTLIRLLGKRTISELNSSDFVLLVAIGSVVASTILGDVAFAQGAAALATMLLLQFATEWVTSRWEPLRKKLDGSPVLVLYRGEFLRDAMRHEQIDEVDILAVARQRGVGRIADLYAVVLEVNGNLSVIPATSGGDDTLSDVTRRHREAPRPH